jgi:DNA mismatch repair protein MutL
VIRVLPVEVANRIAAGEVVDRPAGVVKELVENALDAGARDIRVDLEDGGVKLVRVADDGVGMSAEDLARAVLPHATSKIADVDDLFRVATYGFRGEALPSIGAVARLEITTRAAGAALGSRLIVDGGVAGPVEPCGAAYGTVVEVRNLFQHVPARRAFLKQERAEATQAAETLVRLARPDPEWSLRYTHQGRVSFEAPAVRDRRSRLAALFGDEFAARLLEAEGERGGARLHALFGPPDLVRPTASRQYVFLNRRWIRDRRLSHAIQEAYRGLVMPKDYPAAFLFLEVDPAAVDVNVHPTKAEVRFRDPDPLHALVVRTLRTCLDAAPGGRPLRLGPSEATLSGDAASAFGGYAASKSDGAALLARDAANAPLGGRADVAQAEAPTGVPSGAPGAVRGVAPSAERFVGGGGGGVEVGGGLATGRVPPTGPPGEDVVVAPGLFDRVEPRKDRLGGAERSLYPDGVPREPRFLQVHRSYVVVECDEGVRIVDQHALHERKLFDELRARMAAGEAEDQLLLVPATFYPGPAERSRLLDHADDFARLGLRLEAFGPKGVALRSVPAVLKRARPEELCATALELVREGVGRRDALLDDAVATFACKAAVKFHDALPPEEIRALLAYEEAHPEARNCPHGRNTALVLSLRDLENRFQRKK